MTDVSVAIIGTGPHPDRETKDGYSMGYRHANSYETASGCAVVACADIVEENATDFASTFGLSSDAAYTDHLAMLEGENPDIVSICTPPSTHLSLVTDCADHDAVHAIHCEKPLAPTYGESKEIVDVCDTRGVQLSINLQNRYHPGSAAVKELIQEGTIGSLERIEIARNDLLQTGIHHIDLANYVLNDEPVEWVLGQVHYPDEHIWYTNMPSERQSMGLWGYESGVHGFCSTGEGTDVIGARSRNRFIGTDGEIRGFGSYEIRTAEDPTWQDVSTEGPPGQDAAIQDVIDCFEHEDLPIANGRTALAATEIVFGIWESAARRARINLPLEIEDNPLERLIEAGELPNQ